MSFWVFSLFIFFAKGRTRGALNYAHLLELGKVVIV